jgi:sec-independent protein translocase protein TatA
MPLGIGIWELMVLLGVLLLVFGPKRLPEMGRSLGNRVREVRAGISGSSDSGPGEDQEHAPEPEAR